MSEALEILAEITATDWAAAAGDWTHLPYMLRVRAERLPAIWDSFPTGRFHAVLESGRSGSLTLAVPSAARATVFFVDGRVMVHNEDGAHEEALERPLDYLRRWSREVRAPRLAGWPDFQGGLIALLGYELATQFEPVVSTPADTHAPLAAFLEATEVCIFDAAQKELTVVILCPQGPVAPTLRLARVRAEELARHWHHTGALSAPA